MNLIATVDKNWAIGKQGHLLVNIPEDIKLILNEREDARKNKNFAKSDELRDKLKELGYIVKDTKDGQIIEKV